MKKKHYIAPRIEVYKLHATCMLQSSPFEESSLPWSGDNPGTAGPDEIDPYSTIDVF